jgi:hypothetical protein
MAGVKTKLLFVGNAGLGRFTTPDPVREYYNQYGYKAPIGE